MCHCELTWKKHGENTSKKFSKGRSVLASFAAHTSPRTQSWLLGLSLKSFRGAWVVQSVKHPTLAQAMISWFMGSSPVLGSVLTAQSLKPASDSMSPSLSAPPPLALCLSKMSKNIKNLNLFLKRRIDSSILLENRVQNLGIRKV